MDGESTTIRRRSAALRERGDELRGTATGLLALAAEVPWQGRAAETMGHRLQERARRLTEVADAHDRAAAALERHADAVEGKAPRGPSW